MKERTGVWASLFDAAFPTPEGHSKAERKKNQPWIMMPNRIENTFLCAYTVKSRIDL